MKDVEEFNWRFKDRGKRDTYCRPCRAAYKREHDAKHKQRYIAQAIARRRQVRAERMEFLVDFLRDHPCTDCGEDDPIILEFDHVRGSKLFAISKGLTTEPSQPCSKRWRSARSSAQTVTVAEQRAGPVSPVRR
jgi:hypothetical protein